MLGGGALTRVTVLPQGKPFRTGPIRKVERTDLDPDASIGIRARGLDGTPVQHALARAAAGVEGEIAPLLQHPRPMKALRVATHAEDLDLCPDGPIALRLQVQ